MGRCPARRSDHGVVVADDGECWAAVTERHASPQLSEDSQRNIVQDGIAQEERLDRRRVLLDIVGEGDVHARWSHTRPNARKPS